jgi:hypothetical protein
MRLRSSGPRKGYAKKITFGAGCAPWIGRTTMASISSSGVWNKGRHSAARLRSIRPKTPITASWRRNAVASPTTTSILAGGIAGLVTSLILVILSPAVWKTVLGNPQAIFPYDHPALFSMTLAFLVTYIVSRLDRSDKAMSAPLMVTPFPRAW